MRAPKEANLPTMSELRLFLSGGLLSLAALSISACASLPAGPSAGLRGPAGAETAMAAPDDQASSYGLFLAAQAAARDGDDDRASDYFLRAARMEPDASFLKDRAFLAALGAGDVHRAASLAPAVGEAPIPDQQLGRLTQAVEAMAENHPHDAEAVLAAAPFTAPNRAAGVLLTPWVAAAAGDWTVALALPDAKGDRLIDVLSRLNQALLLERSKHYDRADAAYRGQLADGDTGGIITSAYVDFLQRRGRQAEALGLCDAALKGDPNNRAMRLLRARVAANTPAPRLPTFEEGAGRTLVVPAAEFLAEKQPQLGLNYMQLILRLDPAHDEALMLVGDTKAALGDTDGARVAYLGVSPTSPDYVDARTRLIQTYDGPNEAATVLTLAQETVKAAPNDDEALALLADALSGAEHYDEAAKVLDTLIGHLGAQAGWQAYFMRGVALDHSGHWPEAEADFHKALTLDPDQSEVLNYLGYSWIDRGEKLEEAKAMVERAVSAKPDSGAMVDSLGWAYYKLGDFHEAVHQLERAAELEPADPDINNHLGDAYWRAGRQVEARFQWQRVLTLDPSAKLRAEAEAKLKDGLDAIPQAGPPSTVAAR